MYLFDFCGVWSSWFQTISGLCSGDASAAREQQPGQRKHGAGAGWGSTAALEKAGPGAAQNSLWPPQVVKLNLKADLNTKFRVRNLPGPSDITPVALSQNLFVIAVHRICRINI